ncbi:MAG TPA: glycoside hydrolase family 43 protein [Polyangiales bacterium]|nr:glycoside hydrolase family 43 protein [Polyangiales bacterium]
MLLPKYFGDWIRLTRWLVVWSVSLSIAACSERPSPQAKGAEMSAPLPGGAGRGMDGAHSRDAGASVSVGMSNKDSAGTVASGMAGASGITGASGVASASVGGTSGAAAGAAGASNRAGDGQPATAGTGGAVGAPVAGMSGSGAAGHRSAATFTNPLNRKEGSDPWLVYHEGSYYLAATTWSSEITIKRSKTLGGLADAEAIRVWEGDEASRCCNIWAPEFHLLDGPNGKRWYLYFTAGPSGSNTDNQRMHVLESAGTDPLGPYTYKARLRDPQADSWAIDGSVFLLQDKLYYLFSAWEGDNQNVYIAALRNPWTLQGGRVRISQPTRPWERMTANVNEGPVALQHADRTFIVYSASACWGSDYKLGMLTYEPGRDPLQPEAWVKSPEPVFARADAASVYGPGHNGFFKSPDGSEDWIVYHANSASDGVCDIKRTTRAQPFTWKADGTPDFGKPLPLTTAIPVPSGE